MASCVYSSLHMHSINAFRCLHPAIRRMSGSTVQVLQASADVGQEVCWNEALERLQP